MQQFGNELLKVNSHQSTLPDVKTKRTLFPYNVFPRLQTQIHGVLHPIYCDWVDPMTEKNIVCSSQVLADVQFRQVFDSIFDDVYWFYVPIRLIEPKWTEILADKDVNDEYNLSQFGFAQFKFFGVTDTDGSTDFGSNFLLDYLGWKIADVSLLNPVEEGNPQPHETICAYPLLAFWKVYDEYFRDQKFDEARFPIARDFVDLSTDEDHPNGYDLTDADDAGYGTVVMCPSVNKFHDYFTDAFDKPGASDFSRIGVGNGILPVGATNTGGNPYSADSEIENFAIGKNFNAGEFASPLTAVSLDDDTDFDLGVDTTSLGFTLQQLRLALALSSMAVTQQKYGSRYEEFMYGQFGAELPERIVRPVYLGGSRQALANTPAIDSTGASLGFARGTSMSHLQDLGFSKHLFQEHGIVIGVSVTRVSHSYNQGRNRKLWDLKTRLDLPLKQFLNLDQMALKNSEIYNDPTDGKNDEAFGFIDSYQWEREKYGSVAGVFSFSNPAAAGSTYDDLIKRTSYQDIYTSRPVLSKEWLKEDPKNVMRTMTGVSIPGAGTSTPLPGIYQNPSFIFKYYFLETEIKAIPVHPDIETLTTRW